MAEYTTSELRDPDGRLAWRGPYSVRAESIGHIEDSGAANALSSLLGFKPSPTTRGQVVETAERLGFVSRHGTVRGFIVLEPPAMFLDACVDAFNQPHLHELGATRMEFPLIFDCGDPDLAELTASYERQDRMFRIEIGAVTGRLAYAADPGLFGWLRGRRLRRERLPFAVYSPTPVFRYLKTGEVGGLDRLRQYTVPDLHVLCAPAAAIENFTHCLTLAAAGMRFWFNEAFVQFLDVEEAVLARYPNILTDAPQASAQWTLINLLATRPRYYGMKAGLVGEVGYGAMMLYNLQWDDSNGERFDIKLEGGESPIILHATVAGGWPKMLPVFIGRALGGLGPRVVPPELAATSLMVVPMAQRHIEGAEVIAAKCRGHGIRSAVESHVARRLGDRLNELRAAWQPHHILVGDREIDGADPLIASPTSDERLSLEAYFSRIGPRIARCTPANPLPVSPSPFAE